MIEITDGFCFIMKLCSLPVIVCSQITKPSIEIYKGGWCTLAFGTRTVQV